MSSFTAVLTLSKEQIQSVQNWISTLTFPIRQSDDEFPVYRFTLEGQEQESILIIGDNGVQFQTDIIESMYQGDTLFGLSKDVFHDVIKNQKWVDRDNQSWFDARMPVDEKNFIDYSYSQGTWDSEKNKLWYETDKVWKDRVYTYDLLCSRMASSLSGKHLTLEDILNHSTSGAGEYHDPISIKMILDHLDDEVTTELAREILQETVDENKIRIGRVRSFKLLCANLHRKEEVVEEDARVELHPDSGLRRHHTRDGRMPAGVGAMIMDNKHIEK